MQQHSNTGESSYESLIVACLEPVKAMAWGFVRKASVCIEADELVQVGMLVICEAAVDETVLADPMAYFYAAAKYAMLDEWRCLHGWSTASLDRPLTDGRKSTLYDVLPAPALVSTPVRALRWVQALRGAIRRLSSRKQRAALRRRYGLEGYGATGLHEAAAQLRTTVPAVDSAAARGVRSLVRDRWLQTVVEVTR